MNMDLKMAKSLQAIAYNARKAVERGEIENTPHVQRQISWHYRQARYYLDLGMGGNGQV